MYVCMYVCTCPLLLHWIIKKACYEVMVTNSTSKANFDKCQLVAVFSCTQVESFHSKGVRVIMWMASMVNTDSPNYQEAYNKKYFIR